MWQELNETNQAGSGDDFFQEKLLRTKVMSPPPLFQSYLEFKNRHSVESMLDIISHFLFIEKLFKNYSN